MLQINQISIKKSNHSQWSKISGRSWTSRSRLQKHPCSPLYCRLFPSLPRQGPRQRDMGSRLKTAKHWKRTGVDKMNFYLLLLLLLLIVSLAPMGQNLLPICPNSEALRIISSIVATSLASSTLKRWGYFSKFMLEKKIIIHWSNGERENQPLRHRLRSSMYCDSVVRPCTESMLHVTWTESNNVSEVIWIWNRES